MRPYNDIIRQIDPTADVERVLNIADQAFRYFAEMSREQWAACAAASKG